MNQIKIGNFIAERRKALKLTQLQLAQKLGITDRAILKWENGRSMPDSSLILDLCGILEINVNELLSGEVIEMKEHHEKAELQLLEMAREKEKKDRLLLNLEVFIGMLTSVILIACVCIASYINASVPIRIAIIAAGVIPFIIGAGYAVKLEQVAGYYECALCHHKYVPSYKAVLFSVHICRTRKMRCPKCQKKSYQKKVIG